MDEGLSFSDIFDDNIPYEQKPPEMLRPMEEDDFPTQAKDQFGGLWEENLLTETHLQDLYHATGESALLQILQDDSIKLTFAGGTSADEVYNRGYPYYLSTMRAKYGNFARGFGGPFGDDIPGHYDVVIHLDGDAIKNAGFKAISMDYWGQGPERSEQEERIVSDKPEMKPLSKFIKDIHVYVRKDLEHPYTIDRIHQASKLAPQRNIKIYFYPPGTKNYFQAHRHEKAVTDASQILKPAVYSQDDLEHIAMRKAYTQKYGDRNKVDDLEAFIRIYNGDYSKVENDRSIDERLLRMFRYYPHDAYATLMATVHNYKKEHLPIFRDIVAMMKKEGVKNFKDLITLVIDKETKRLQTLKEIRIANELLCEADELRFDIGKYDYSSSQAFCVFIIYPEFAVWYKKKNNKVTFYSDKEKLQNKLDAFNGREGKTHGTIRWVLQQISNQPESESILPKRPYTEATAMLSVEQVSGRMWGIQGKLYISFWQDLTKVKPYWDKVEKLIKNAGQNPEKALYLFGGADTEEFLTTYDEVHAGKNKFIADEKERVLQRLMHLSPEVKKAMIFQRPNQLQHWADELGMTAIELKQKLGGLDEVQYVFRPGNKIHTNWHTAHGIFTLYDKTMVVMKDLRNRYQFYSTDSEIEQYLNRPDFQQYAQDKYKTDKLVKDRYQMTHGRLKTYAEHAFGKKYPNQYIDLEKKGEVAGRVWIYSEIAIVGFWQNIDVVRHHWKQIIWALHKLDIDETKALYTFEDNFRSQYTYNDITGETKVAKEDPRELELKKLVHTNPTVKRGLLKLGSNRLQHYADQLGIPLIKLKHLLGSMDENNVDKVV